MSKSMKLFFDLVDKKKKDLTNASTGKAFEDKIEGLFRESGFGKVSLNDEDNKELAEYIQSIKPTVLGEKGYSLLENTLGAKNNKYKNIFVSQPYGSQNFPDFMVFAEDKIFAIEIKYSTGNNRKPQLNGHIPMGHDIYIYGSYGARDVTYLAGFDYTSKELETLLCKQEKERADLFEKHHNEMEYAVNSLGLDNHFGVETYPRKAYTTKKFNDKTIINWIGNPYAPIYEKNVRNFVLNPDDPEVEKIDYSKDLSDTNENED